MSPRQKYLEALLRDWAQWEFDCNSYPSRTAECSAGEGRSPNKPGSRIPKGVEQPRHLRSITEAVRVLGDFHPDLKFVINLRYGIQDDGRPRDSAVQHMVFRSTVGRGPRTFHEWLGRAHAWLDGRLL